MIRPALRLRSRRLRAACLCGFLLLPLGGCPINGDDLTISVVEAALTSITNSLVEALTAQLDGTTQG